MSDTHTAQTAQTAQPVEYSPSNSAVYEVLLLFLGGLGVHRIYLGKISGVIFVFTLGGFLGVWPLIDLIIFASGGTRDKEGRPLHISAGEKAVAWVIFALGIVGGLLSALILGACTATAGKALHDLDQRIKQSDVEMRKAMDELDKAQREMLENPELKQLLEENRKRNQPK